MSFYKRVDSLCCDDVLIVLRGCNSSQQLQLYQKIFINTNLFCPVAHTQSLPLTAH